MTPPIIDALNGKTIKRCQVFSNIVVLELDDGSVADVRIVDGALRLHHTRKLDIEGAPLAVAVFPGEFPRELP